jgi:hypothetical protein
MRPALTRREAALAMLATAVPLRAGAQTPRKLGPHLQLQSGSTGWLDFTLHREGQIFIPATVNGVPVEVFLDSGVSMLVLDTGLAERLGVTPRREVKATGTVGRTKIGLSNAAMDLSLGGGLRLVRKGAALVDLSDLSTMGARPLQVMLGSELFNEAVVDIDFPRRRIAIHDPGQFSPPPGAVAVPLKRRGKLRSVPVSIAGLPPVDATFDIGSNGTLLISPAFAAEQKLLQGRRTTTTQNSSLTGRSVSVQVCCRASPSGAWSSPRRQSPFRPPGAAGERARR